MRQIYDDGSRYEKTALLARVQRMSRRPHHKQNPLHMQGGFGKYVNLCYKNRLTPYQKVPI